MDWQAGLFTNSVPVLNIAEPKVDEERPEAYREDEVGILFILKKKKMEGSGE